MSTRFLFVRHGQSVANAAGVFIGQTDLPLSALGQKQAQLLCDGYLSKKQIDFLYSSDLKRAIETIQPTAASKQMTIHTDQRFREIYGGDWEGKSFEQLTREYRSEYGVWLQNISEAVCTKGESTANLRLRLLGAVRNLAEQYPGKTVCVATHAMAIRSLTPDFFGQPFENCRLYPFVHNASVTTVDYCPQAERFTLVEFDRCDYLENLATALPNTV